MIKAIYLNDTVLKDYRCKRENGKSNVLDALNKINIFIGPNNSGKSRFLRQLFHNEALEIKYEGIDTEVLEELFTTSLTEALYEAKQTTAIVDCNAFMRIRDAIKYVKDTKTQTNIIRSYPRRIYELIDFLIHLDHLSSVKFNDGSGRAELKNKQFQSYLNDMGHKLQKKISKLFPEEIDWNEERIYLPILRGLRPLQLNQSKNYDGTVDNYKERTVHDYFRIGANGNNNKIFTGLGLYNETKRLLLNTKAERNRIKYFEDFLSKTFFLGQSVSLIPHIEDDVLYIGIGTEPERPVYELGDGIQSIIIILYPLFINQGKNLLVFIEEPELSLHPGMQRILLEALLRDEFSGFQYFITTHSNHFLDITLDLNQISIYSFNKDMNAGNCVYTIENTNNNDIKLLDLIGVRNSSIFLSNCTVWVEGITDRLYIKRYLEVYQEHLIQTNKIKNLFKEDLDFSFVEYGGANIVHWSFTNADLWDKIRASRISNRIFLIVDKDDSEKSPKSEKAKRIQLLQENLKEHFRVVDGREIENILSANVLLRTIARIENSSETDLKYDNKRLRELNYKNSKMGEFIQKTFPEVKRKYAADSGTIANKVEFCKKAILEINSIADFSTAASVLIEDIYNFISINNK